MKALTNDRARLLAAVVNAYTEAGDYLGFVKWRRTLPPEEDAAISAVSRHMANDLSKVEFGDGVPEFDFAASGFIERVYAWLTGVREADSHGQQ